MNAKEAAIKEKRHIEAMKKKLMGPSGKLGTIAKYLGKKITSEGASYGLFENDELNHPVFNNEDLMKNIPIMSENIYTRDIGWLFEGISWGVHLEIKYLDEDNRLTVDFKGYPVYVETSGDLDRYAPSDEWEDIIVRLYKKSLERKKIVEKENAIELEKIIEHEKQGFIQKMKTKWGL